MIVIAISPPSLDKGMGGLKFHENIIKFPGVCLHKQTSASRQGRSNHGWHLMPN
jgi:hypothetical protein